MDRRTKFVLFTILLVIVWNFTSSFLGLGWITATIITFAIITLNMIYIYRYQDALLGRFLLFGLAAGWTELLADRWLVEATGTLVYVPGGPFVMRSPLYMPFAWAVVLVQIGYIGWRLAGWLGTPAASILTALLGAVNIPLYEQWARGANWWFYQNAPMLGHTPWFIICGEALITLALPGVLLAAEKAPPGWSIALGILQGLWIWVSYAFFYTLLG